MDENELLANVLRRYILNMHGTFGGYLGCDMQSSIVIDGWVDVTPDELALIRRLDAESRAADNARYEAAQRSQGLKS